MKITEKIRKHKTLLIIGVVATISIGYIAMGRKEAPPKTLPAYQNMGEEMEVFNKAMFEDSLPMEESLALLNSKLKNTEMLYQDYFVGAYVEKLTKRAEKINVSFTMFKDDFKYYVGDDVTRINSKLEADDPILMAIIHEIESPYFLILGDSIENARIGVNFEYISDLYGDMVTPDFNNRLEIMDFSKDYLYYEVKDGRPNFKNIYKRYQKIAKMLERKGNENNLYLMGESYDTYFSILGLASEGMNESEDKYNEIALNEMEKFISSNKGTETGKEMQLVLNSIKDEGKYGEKTDTLAKSILDERFKEYIELMKHEIELETETKK